MNLKLEQNKSRADLDSAPQYVLHFKTADGKTRYHILSSLIQNSNLLLEVNSGRFIANEEGKDEYFKKILQFIRNNDLEYTYQKAEGKNKSFFKKLFSGVNSVHKILSYVPNQFWKSEEILNIMPVQGATYYILDDDGGESALQDINKMMDDEILEYFKVIVFDPGSDEIKQMGINTTKLSRDELQECFDEYH